MKPCETAWPGDEPRMRCTERQPPQASRFLHSKTGSYHDPLPASAEKLVLPAPYTWNSFLGVAPMRRSLCGVS